MNPKAPIPQDGAPRPSWGPPPRGVFIDVFGTIVAPAADGESIPRFEDAEFYEGVLDALFRVTQSGWNLYLVGNMNTVAFGHQSIDEWKIFQAELHAHMRGLGIKLRRDYTCVDHPEGVKGRDRDSVYMLPGTGAMHHAAQADSVRLPLCWVIGDSTVELVAGWRAGCRVASVATGVALGDRTYHVDPEMSGASAAGVLREIAQDMTMLRTVA